MPRALKIAAGFAVVLAAAGLARSASADPNVKIIADKGSLKGGVFTQTLFLENDGDTDAVGAQIVSQPYNTIKPDPDHPRLHTDAATPQTKIVTIPAHSGKIVTFTFSGADAKDWKWKYTDVYKPLTHKLYSIDSADIGAWSALLLLPSSGPVVALQDVPLFYPNAVYALRDGDPADFSFSIDALSLPAGWTLTGFDPAPGSVFTLSGGDLFDLQMAIATNGPTRPGDRASLDYSETELDDGLVYHGSFDILVVPEPEAWTLMLIGFAGIGLAARRRAGPIARVAQTRDG